MDAQLAGIVGRDQDERRREVARNIGNWGSLRQFRAVVNEVGNSYVIKDGSPRSRSPLARMVSGGDLSPRNHTGH